MRRDLGACARDVDRPPGLRGGDDTVGDPHRAQIWQFELFELILLLNLDKQFPVERFEANVSQSAVPSSPLKDKDAAKDSKKASGKKARGSVLGGSAAEVRGSEARVAFATRCNIPPPPNKVSDGTKHALTSTRADEYIGTPGKMHDRCLYVKSVSVMYSYGERTWVS